MGGLLGRSRHPGARDDRRHEVAAPPTLAHIRCSRRSPHGTLPAITLGLDCRSPTSHSYLDNLGTQAALLAGFAFTCYTDDLGLPDDLHPFLEGVFMVCVSTCVATMLFTVRRRFTHTNVAATVAGGKREPQEWMRREHTASAPPQVVSSTLVSSLGPAMALRGKDGTAMRVGARSAIAALARGPERSTRDWPCSLSLRDGSP
eukprot:956339-Prymnesium_polylepis.2